MTEEKGQIVIVPEGQKGFLIEESDSMNGERKITALDPAELNKRRQFNELV